MTESRIKKPASANSATVARHPPPSPPTFPRAPPAPVYTSGQARFVVGVLRHR